VEERLGGKIRETRYAVWIGSRQGAPVGYGVVLDITGKEQPITFMVAVSPDGSIIGIEVLIYRESQGSDIRSARFMRQFTGKTLDAPLKLNRDIDSISGATLSSRSTTHAAKKALALVDVVYGEEAHDE
jgi:Na+-translocating ferredoxin:NAD+ oxidoreductase RnfG subunit